MSPSESRLLSHVSDTASTCILWEYMKFDNSVILSYYRKRFRASYIVREVHSVRERERDTERERERERERETEVTSPLSR